MTLSVCIWLISRAAWPFKTRGNVCSGQNTSRAADLHPTAVLMNRYRNLSLRFLYKFLSKINAIPLKRLRQIHYFGT